MIFSHRHFAPRLFPSINSCHGLQMQATQVMPYYPAKSMFDAQLGGPQSRAMTLDD
jgi:hypothetical protein